MIGASCSWIFFGSTEKESTRLSRMSRSYKTILMFSQFNGYMYNHVISQLDLSPPPTTATMKYHCNAGVPQTTLPQTSHIFHALFWGLLTRGSSKKKLLMCCFLGKRNKNNASNHKRRVKQRSETATQQCVWQHSFQWKPMAQTSEPSEDVCLFPCEVWDHSRDLEGELLAGSNIQVWGKLHQSWLQEMMDMFFRVLKKLPGL